MIQSMVVIFTMLNTLYLHMSKPFFGKSRKSSYVWDFVTYFIKEIASNRDFQRSFYTSIIRK